MVNNQNITQKSNKVKIIVVSIEKKITIRMRTFFYNIKFIIKILIFRIQINIIILVIDYIIIF